MDQTERAVQAQWYSTEIMNAGYHNAYTELIENRGRAYKTKQKTSKGSRSYLRTN